MLTYFRERMSRTFITIILVAIAVAFAFVGLQGGLHGSAKSDVIASVDGETITAKEWQQSYFRLLLLLPAQQRDQVKTDLKEQAFWRLRAFEHVQMNKAAKSGLRDSGYHLNHIVLERALRESKTFHQDGHFSLELFHKYLSEVGSDEDGFIERLRLNVLIGQLQDVLALSSFVLPNEMERWEQLSTEQRSISYVAIDAKDLPVQKLHMVQLKDYYEQNKTKWQQPEKVQLNYLILDPESVQLGKPTDDKLKAFYHEHIGWFTAPPAFQCEVIEIASSGKKGKMTRANIDQILQKYHGSDEQQVALRRLLESNDRRWEIQPATKIKGAYPWYSLASLPPEVIQALKQLGPKQSTKPLIIHGRYYIYRLVNKRLGQAESFAKVRSKVERLWKEQVRQEKWSEQIETLRDLAYTYPEDLEKVAKHMGGVVQQTGWLKKEGQDKVHGWFTEPKDLDHIIFDEEWLMAGKNSEPLLLSDGRMLVVHLAGHKKSSVAPLEEVYDQVAKSYRTYHAQQMLEEHANRIYEQWQAKPMQSLKGLVIHKKIFNPVDGGRAPFDVSALKQIYQMDFTKNRIMKISKKTNGYWIIRLDGVKKGQPLSRVERKGYRNQLRKDVAESDFYLFRSVLLDHKDFKIENEALLKQILAPRRQVGGMW